MKMRINTILMFLPFVLFTCCNKEKDDCYFNGEIYYIDGSLAVEKKVTSESISLEGLHSGMIAVQDSLLICWNPDYPEHFFEVFNVDTGNDHGFFCRKGQGKDESISVNCVFQFFERKGDLMTILRASNEEKLFLWNISQSIKRGMTVYDTIISYENGRVFFQFYQNDDNLFIYKPSEMLTTGEATTPFYEKRTVYTNRLIQRYPIYKVESVQNPNEESPVDFFFYTWDAIKPDGSKIVQVMRHLPQINILDTRTGKLTGYRIKEKPDFSLVETDMESMDVYYNCVHADDEYIYATYWGKEAWDDRWGVELPSFNMIHVFNWDGELLYKLVTDRSFFRVWVDSSRKRLYTIDMNTDEIYYLDLKTVVD